MDIDKAIVGCFTGTIGQERVVRNVIGAILAYLHGLRLPSFMLVGAAGIGKTHILRATEKALNLAIAHTNSGANSQSVWFNSADEFGTYSSNGWHTLSAAICEVRPLVFCLDEIQTLHTSNVPTKTTVHNWVKETLDDGSANGRELRFKASSGAGSFGKGETDRIINVCHRTVSILTGTNFPGALKDKDALRRRFKAGYMELSLYNVEEIAQITQLKLANMGVRACEKTLMRIARCGKGTCEAPDKIADKLAEIAANQNKKTVNVEDVKCAQLALEMYPRGLDRHEIEMMRACVDNPVKLTSLSLMLKKEQKVIRESVSSLLGQRNEEKKVIPFVKVVDGKGITTTETGKNYLNAIAKEGFKI